MHVTWRFGFDAPTVSLPMNKPPSKAYTWVIYIFKGTPEAAVKFANIINVNPQVVLE